ncbi:uncharacterized protein VP01_1892g5 [Puccinia sorghi]|uniref:Uncharacterized protein n=1 Tax=Puccinia sorghi TaxID=27349 RepID=A0A0L6VD32_9BASI|nr:uncharacterized protein VP01_1892g5 [Puccinia sorghi]
MFCACNYAIIIPVQCAFGTVTQMEHHTTAKTPTKSTEGLVPAPYHQYLPMFKKSAAQEVPERHQYDFHIIPLSPAENKDLDMLMNE